jgi:hypothetical protein
MKIPSKLERLLFGFFLGYINQPIHAKMMLALQRHTFASIHDYHAHISQTHPLSWAAFQREIKVLREVELITCLPSKSDKKHPSLIPSLTSLGTDLLARAQSTVVPKSPLLPVS